MFLVLFKTTGMKNADLQVTRKKTGTSALFIENDDLVYGNLSDAEDCFLPFICYVFWVPYWFIYNLYFFACALQFIVVASYNPSAYDA